jgi:hypothetical protein
MEFINQQINTWFKFNTWICKLQFGFFPRHHSLWYFGYRIGENKERWRKNVGERTGPISEWGFNRYVQCGKCEVLFCSVVLLRNAYAWIRPMLLGIFFKYTFVYSEENNRHRLWSAHNNLRKSVSFSWQFTLKNVTNICIILPLFVDFDQGKENCMNNSAYVPELIPA